MDIRPINKMENNGGLGGGYSPITKSLNVDEVLSLIQLSHELPEVSSWQEEALYRLPQPSRVRRKEIIRAVLNTFLKCEDDHFVATPLIELVMLPNLSDQFKQDMIFFQYIRCNPLVWEAINHLVLPRAEAGEKQRGKEENREVSISDWHEFLTPVLSTTTPGTIDKTRRILNAHLTKFGVLEALPIPGKRIGKRYFAHFYQPDIRAFWFSLVQEFVNQGWTSRSEHFICESSWTRIAFCTTTAYSRFALDEAERHDLIAIDFFGSEKQVTLRGPDPITRLVEVIRYA